MKKVLLPLTGLAMLSAVPAAQAEISGNIGVTSNYLWRGVSQTMNSAAVSGGIDYSHEKGFYAGTWISNVDWGSPEDDLGTGAEVDFYAGFSGGKGDFGYDVGYIYYYYPNFTDADFGEIYGSLSYKWIEGGIAYTVNKSADGPTNDLYYYLSGSWDLPQDWSIGATIGHYDFKDGGDADYTHGQLDLGKSLGEYGDVTFTVSKVSGNSFEGEDVWDEDVLFAVSWAKEF